MTKVKFLYRQVCRQVGGPVQIMRNILAILALFVCTSICQPAQTIDINEDNEYERVYGNGVAVSGMSTGHGHADKAPSGNTVNIIRNADNIGDVYGAYMDNDTEYSDGISILGPMTGNKVKVSNINHGCGDFGSNDIYGACSRRTTANGNEVNDNKKEAKGGTGKKYGYDDEPATYGGCALGGGYKHKVSEKIDLDWSLRYMLGYQDEQDVEKPVDADGNRVKLESVKSSRIRVGVRGKYVELEKVKPYIWIGYEHELSGEVKGEIQNGVDNVGDIPATSVGGGTGIGELGISGKVGKLDVGISGQGYLGVRKGFGGMLKLKYAFVRMPMPNRNQKARKKETVELERVSDPKDAYKLYIHKRAM